MNTILDGGYYAIKGFNFQYDYTILKILEQTNESQYVEIEQTEDYSERNLIVQVKYKERTNYSDSQVKKPICQLLEIFKTDKRKPILYSYFKNKKEEEVKLSMQQLNNILGDCKIKNKQYSFSEKLKKEFINEFRMIFTMKYHDQFEYLIKKLMGEFGCEEDEAVIYYAQIYKYIEGIVINNSPEDQNNRVCTKVEIKELITRGREIVFHSSYSQLLGKEKYYKFIYKEFFREANINFHERFFLIETPHDYNDVDRLKKITLKIMNKYYKTGTFGGTSFIKSPAPYIFFQNINYMTLKKLKTNLLIERTIIRDGFSFEDSDFFLDNLIEVCTPQNNIEIKFINRKEYIKEIIDNISNQKRIYNLYSDKHIEGLNDIDINYIKIDDFEDIGDFLF